MRRIASLVSLVLLVASCHGGSSAKIRIGVLLPYSADTADYYRSMELAIAEVTAAGGGHGRPLELLLYDVMWDADISYASFHQAVDDGSVIVVGGLASFLAVREAEAALERRVPLVGCCSTSDALTTLQAPGPDRFLYRVSPPDRMQSVVIAESAYDRPELACRNLGIVHVNDTYGAPLAAGIAEAFVARGGTLAGNVSHEFFSEDFSSQVATLAAGNPDCIVLVSNVDDGRRARRRSGRFARRRRRARRARAHREHARNDHSRRRSRQRHRAHQPRRGRGLRGVRRRAGVRCLR